MKSVRVSLPTNVQIIASTRADNTIIVQIPRANYWLYGEKRPDTSWKVDILEPEGRRRSTVFMRITEQKFAALIHKVLKKPMDAMKNVTSEAVKGHIKRLVSKYNKKHTPTP